jgi:outer membrane protein OmpA-like peptidoglycan-associated protein
MINRKIILATVMTLALGACSTVSGMGDDLSSLFGTKKHEAVTPVYNGSSTDGSNWLDAKGNPMNPPSKDVDLSYNRMAGEVATTNSSVQLFSLDGGSAPAPVQKIDRRSAGTSNFGMSGVPSSTDNSVTVFPFSNDMYTPGVKPGFNGYGRRPEGNNYLANTVAPIGAVAANTIYFAHGSSALSAGARRKIVAIAQSYSGGMVQIDGHASHRTGVKDPVKSELINFQMSMKRAMGVMKSLMKEGVPAKAMKVTAHGDAEPAVPETDRHAEARNRRVEIDTRP